MARMIPEGGPNLTASYQAEPAVYQGLARLDDTFTVIHSLPWLRAVVKTLDKKFAPTGEIDFVVLHPELGILAIEVKGGVFRYDRTRFVYLRSNQAFDPIGQLRRGTFALTEWVRQAGVTIPAVGYAWIFPDVDTQGKRLPPAMVDPACPGGGPIIDIRGMLELDRHVVNIMCYWQQTLRPARLAPAQIDQIVDLICPVAEYDPGWDAQVEIDSKTWLTFTTDQARILKNLLRESRTVVTGRPGTGKTVLALALARRLAQDGQRVLFLMFNSPIARKIRAELSDTPGVDVQTFHGLCGRAGTILGYSGSRDEAWFEQAYLYLEIAVEQDKMGRYDALIVDEGQIFRLEWWAILRKWIRRIHVFCDDTQVFPLEFSLPYEEIANLLGGEEVRLEILTVNLRSPRAVFDRIQMALPTPYQQYSPRPDQPGTLTEVAVLDVDQELRRVLRELNRAGVPPAAIAVIHEPTKREYPEEIKALAGTIDTSSRLRGMEYPIVIVHDMHSLTSRMYAINAYARATTRVVGIYSLWNLRLYENPDRERDPFIAALLDNPELAQAINDPWNYLVDRLGWELTPVQMQTISLFWSPTLGAWVCQGAWEDSLSEEIWTNHILLQTPYPVLVCVAARGYVRIKLYELARRDLAGKQVRTIWDISTCPKCERLCVKERQTDRPWCLHCQPATSKKSFPNDLSRRLADCEQVLEHPDQYSPAEKRALGPHLFALGVVRTLPDEEFDLLVPYVRQKLRHRNGYQPLLALTGFDIIKTAPGQELVLANLEQRYRNWLGRQYYPSLRQVLPSCLEHWKIKGWLESIQEGAYRRVAVLPPFYQPPEKQE